MSKNFRAMTDDDGAEIDREIAGMTPYFEACMIMEEVQPLSGHDEPAAEAQGEVRDAAERLLGFTGGNGILVSENQRRQYHLDHLAGLFIRNALFAVGLRREALAEGDARLIEAARWLARNQSESQGTYGAYARRHGDAVPAFHECFRRAQMRLDEAVKHLDPSESGETPQES